jgi:hypothetical protein
MMVLAQDWQDEESCRREVARAILAFPGKLLLSEGTFDCVLDDLSLGGARFSCNRKIDSGREVWLKFDRFEVFGTVTWVHGRQYGVEFEQRLAKSVIIEMRSYAADYEAYEKHQGTEEAKAYVIGEGRVVRSPLMRLLDVVGPINRKEFSACLQCARGESCSTHCGHKKFRRARIKQAVLYLALGAVIGAATGIGSVFFG